MFAFCASLATAAEARIIGDDVEKLRPESDLIVIGHVLAVKETADETTLPGWGTPLPVLGVDTTFRADSVLRGELTNTIFVVRHYRLRDSSKIYINGPLLTKFNRGDESRQYLLFLKRGLGGKYEPTGGQADAEVSFKALLRLGEGPRQTAADEIRTQEQLGQEAERIQQEPTAPLILEFVSVETPYGLRRAPKVKAVNRTDKAVRAFSSQVVAFDQQGEILWIRSIGAQSAVGQLLVPAAGEGLVTLDDGRENYEMISARAVVTAVTFEDGASWHSAKR